MNRTEAQSNMHYIYGGFIMIMRRLLSLMLAFSLLMYMPMVSFAAEDNTTEKNKSETRAVEQNASFSVTDQDGNRFNIYGYNYTITKGTSKYAASCTSFFTAYYISGTEEGKEALDARNKTVSVTANAYLAGGASVPYTKTNYYLSGQSNSVVATSSELLYVVTSIVGTHSFSFNGGSGNGSSTYVS